MIHKESVFAQGGAQDPSKRNESSFRTGMVPNTIAMAEDVNTYGNMSDGQLKVVCDEIENAIIDQGFELNESENNQLSTVLKTKLSGGFTMTGIDRKTYTGAPTQSGNKITFPAFDVIFNKSVYYGTSQNDLQRVHFDAQTFIANSTWEDGSYFIYATNTGIIDKQKTPVLGRDGATKCMLGSAFVQNGSFQMYTDASGQTFPSWKFQPWLQITSVEQRESPVASRKGGYITGVSGQPRVNMGALEILDEGINFDLDPNAPLVKNIEARTPMSYKYLYPGYNSAAAGTYDIDTTHCYNMSSGEWVDISAHIGKFIVIVPCITPNGQTLMIPAMGNPAGDSYTCIFDSMDKAISAVANLQYNLGNVADRVIYLGQSLVVQIGMADASNPAQMATVAVIPQALSGFTNASGQTGGGVGAYIPMPETEWPQQESVACQINCSNVVQGMTTVPVTVLPPTDIPRDYVGQFGIKYIHRSGYQGLTFPNNWKWWGTPPVFTNNYAYNIIVENFSGTWIAGFLSTSIA